MQKTPTPALNEAALRAIDKLFDQKDFEPLEECRFDDATSKRRKLLAFLKRNLRISKRANDEPLLGLLHAIVEAHLLFSVEDVCPTVVSTSPMEQNAYVKVTTDDLRFPNTPKHEQPFKYHFLVVRARWTLIIAAEGASNERVILNTLYRHPNNRVSIELPAGFCDDAMDEGDPRKTAARELEEETGYISTHPPEILHDHVTALDGVVRSRGSYVLLRNVTPTGRASLDAHERQAQVQTHLCSWPTIFALIHSGDITSATTMSALYRAAQSLGKLHF